MSSMPRAAMVCQFRMLFENGSVAGLTDGQLLERFVERRDESRELAFEALVTRHGPMVLGVCRRALADPNDAADAFQATFLILVKKARSIRVEDSLGRWLYGVSRRVAARARIEAATRPRTIPDTLEALATDPDRFEPSAILDEELCKLPESFRSALILCELEGLTHEEAARDLCCPVGTIKSRLARGRQKLRERLERRGLASSMILLNSPTLPSRLAQAAVLASRIAFKPGITSGIIPATSLTLAQGVLKTMSGFQLKLAVAAVLSLGMMTTAAGVVAQGQKNDGKAVTVETQPLLAVPSVAIPLDEHHAGHVVEIRDDTIIKAALNNPVSVNFKDCPLDEALRTLGTYTHLKFAIDEKSMGEAGLSEQAKVNLTADGIKLRLALQSMLRPLGLDFRVEGDVIVIACPTLSKNWDIFSRAYQPRLDTHKEKRKEEQETTLNRLVTVDLVDRPLEQIVENLAKQTKVNIILDPKALNDLGLVKEKPVTLTVDKVRLSAALEKLVTPLFLTYVLDDSCVVITNPPVIDKASKERLRFDILREIKLAKSRLADTSDDRSPARSANQARARARLDEIIEADRQFHQAMVLLQGKKDSQIERSALSTEPATKTGPEPKTEPPALLKKGKVPDYIVEPPDILNVEVVEALQGKPISGEHLVKPDGKISLGFYGEVYVAGLTLTEIKARVALHLRDYLDDRALGLIRNHPGTLKLEKVDPSETNRVFVDVVSFNSKVYFVQGEVARPGRFPVTGNETVLDAINLAGGLINTPGRTIRLVRPKSVTNQQELSLPVDLAAIIETGDTTTNYPLRPGDRLIVYRDPKEAEQDAARRKEKSGELADVESRLRSVESKLDRILQSLEAPPKP